MPEVVGVGVRYQVAPSNRSARAWCTPAVSAPASGCPPTKRGSAWAATTARFVDPTSPGAQALAGGQRDRAADQPHADDGDDHVRLQGPPAPVPRGPEPLLASRTSVAPRSHRGGELIEHGERRVPGHAGVGDRLTVGEG